jgi:hypothetical protein
MFSDTQAFNQPLGKWNLSSCLNMNSIFENAKAFDQDVESWPNWEGKDLEREVEDTGSASASEDEEDSEEDISSEEEQDPSDQSDGD